MVEIVRTLIAGAAVAGLLAIITKFREVRDTRAGLSRDMKGEISLFPTMTLVGNMFDNARNIWVFGIMRFWYDRRELYKHGWDIIAMTTMFPVRNNILISDAAAIKEITMDRYRYPKPLDSYEGLNVFGTNIVFSEGDLWKTYRKLSSPAFADRNNYVVWETTMKLIDKYIEERGDTHVWDNFLDYALEITISILTVSAFGKSIEISQEPPPGHTMTFQEVAKVISCHFVLLVTLPQWIPFVPEKVRKAREAGREFKSYMNEMIENRNGPDNKSERIDLFSILLESHENGELKKDELLGNMFMFLIAGHETTSHALCYAFSLLALYPDVQEKLYQHCRRVWPTDRQPTYHDMNLFTYTNAVLYESFRMCPIVSNIPKTAAVDSQLTVGGASGETAVFPIPKGSLVGLHVVGLHYNPRYWENPEEFRPERFLGSDWPRDAFMPFSGGPRSCLGRKFAEVEATVIMTRLVMQYKISITEEPQFAHESLEQRKERVMRSYQGISLTPYRTPLTFTRR